MGFMQGSRTDRLQDRCKEVLCACREDALDKVMHLWAMALFLWKYGSQDSRGVNWITVQNMLFTAVLSHI
eukprot:355336-Pelagomonas_calceolata.AAC.1